MTLLDLGHSAAVCDTEIVKAGLVGTELATKTLFNAHKGA